ncbi:hypothetical protein OHA98_04165 [Streptomyces sp. NBC_00654]|uniref:hypothetical protein n=1 Tax=Streptomyces sp. NBC_00654 TaxID=2975799 RepID=UPI00224DFC88|nr:hypothetical protein [Streptomyces sp. NBC_00654]MCX4964026.1 hypothetical protein [Streptomyces sp. NBC_00654]
MGFYDSRCAVTGISLRGTDAVAVGLMANEGGYRPVTLGITGNYNRLGSIDGIERDRNSDSVFEYFCRRAWSGDFVMAKQYADAYGDPPHDIDSLLSYFERNVSDSSEERPAATLYGRRVFSVLIARPVWNALAAGEFAPGGDAPEVWFTEVFGDAREPGELYRGCLAEVARDIRALAAVNGFLGARGTGWSLPDEDEIGGQHYAPEMREYLSEARTGFQDVPSVLRALDVYAEAAGELLEDD